MRRTSILIIIVTTCLTAGLGQVGKNTTSYFPVASFHEAGNAKLDSFVVGWYSTQLVALHEPVLYNNNGITDVYRFTWLRTFHHPVAIRIEQQAGNVKLFWKVCDGAGGYAPGKLTIDKQKTLDKKDWDEFIRRLAAIDFWHMAARLDDTGVDGSEWILEGKSGNQYHVVERWTPGEKSSYYQCCDFLLHLTDLKIDGKEKY